MCSYKVCLLKLKVNFYERKKLLSDFLIIVMKFYVAFSGESGAGKTESSKLLIKQIVHLSKDYSTLEQQIIQVQDIHFLLHRVLIL